MEDGIVAAEVVVVIASTTGSGDAKTADEKAPLVNSGSPSKDVSALKTRHDEGVTSTKVSGKKVGVLMLAEWVAFLCIMGVLISSLTVDTLKQKLIWGLRLWKWCVLASVILCGRLFSSWSVNVLVFLIERVFFLKEKVLYFVYGVKTSVKVFIWLCLVLLAWGLLINSGVERSKDTTKIIGYVTRALGAFLISAAVWLLKTLLVKTIAANYQCTRFFQRIRESIFHHYVVETLLHPPQDNDKGRVHFINSKNEKRVEIDVGKMHKLKPGKVSSWAWKEWVDITRDSWMSTISTTPGRRQGELKNEDIGSQKQAGVDADRIFKNVAKPGAENMEEEDLLNILKEDSVRKLLLVLEAKKIEKSDFKKWLVQVYDERELLARSLNDSKTAIEELNRLLSAVVLVLAVIVWLLMMGLLTTKIILLISSQLLLAAFMFGNAAKTLFDAIIFVFVMHPFDLDDRCVIDGVQMIVEEMNILTTIFLRYDGEKIFYPNSLLLTKPISNFNRSPKMSDSVEFDVHISTTAESISELEAKIQAYLNSRPDYWRSDFSLLVKEIEHVNKMKIGLYVNHTINFQDYGVKSKRRSELMLALKKWFEELGIKYHLLPQEVHVRNLGTVATT